MFCNVADKLPHIKDIKNHVFAHMKKSKVPGGINEPTVVRDILFEVSVAQYLPPKLKETRNVYIGHGYTHFSTFVPKILYK